MGEEVSPRYEQRKEMATQWKKSVNPFLFESLDDKTRAALVGACDIGPVEEKAEGESQDVIEWENYEKCFRHIEEGDWPLHGEHPRDVTRRTVGVGSLDTREAGSTELGVDIVDIVAVADMLVDEAVNLAIVMIVLVGIGATLVGGRRDEEHAAWAERGVEICEDSLVGLDMLHDIDGEDEVIGVWTGERREVGLFELDLIGETELGEEPIAIGDLLLFDIHTRYRTAIAETCEAVGILTETATGIEGVGLPATTSLSPFAESLANMPRAEQEQVEELVEEDAEVRRGVEETAERPLYGIVVHRGGYERVCLGAWRLLFLLVGVDVLRLPAFGASHSPGLIGEETVDILKVAEAIIDEEGRLGDDAKLLADSLAKGVSDGDLVLVDIVENLLCLGLGENGDVELCDGEVGRDARNGDGEHGSESHLGELALEHFSYLFLEEA